MTSPPFTLAVAGPSPGSGCSTTAFALAWALGREGRRVVVLDRSRDTDQPEAPARASGRLLWDNVFLGTGKEGEADRLGAEVVVVDCAPVAAEDASERLAFADGVVLALAAGAETRDAARALVAAIAPENEALEESETRWLGACLCALEPGDAEADALLQGLRDGLAPAIEVHGVPRDPELVGWIEAEGRRLPDGPARDAYVDLARALERVVAEAASGTEQAAAAVEAVPSLVPAERAADAVSGPEAEGEELDASSAPVVRVELHDDEDAPAHAPGRATPRAKPAPQEGRTRSDAVPPAAERTRSADVERTVERTRADDATPAAERTRADDVTPAAERERPAEVARPATPAADGDPITERKRARVEALESEMLSSLEGLDLDDETGPPIDPAELSRVAPALPAASAEPPSDHASAVDVLGEGMKRSRPAALTEELEEELSTLDALAKPRTPTDA